MPEPINIAGRTLTGRLSRLLLTAGNGTAALAAGKTPPVVITPHAIKIQNHFVYLNCNPPIKHVEHLFSALYGLRIFSVLIHLNSRELPFFDGSCAPFVRALAGRMPARCRPLRSLARPFKIQAGGSFLGYEPQPARHLIVDMCLEHRWLGCQRLRLPITPRTYRREIAPARTFAFASLRDPRLVKLPPYGFAVTARGIISRQPLRYPDEAVRHKILDLLGDLYVLGIPLAGTIRGYNTSHRLNHLLVRKMAEFIS